MRSDSETFRAVVQKLPKPGDVFAGKYRVDSLLGVGGMGGVFLALDLTLNRLVAIKLVLPHLLDREESRLRFLCEAQAMAAIRHENVVPIFDFGTHQDCPFIVMAYIKGSTLDERIDSTGMLSIDEAVGLVEGICKGVAAIHQCGIVHGDLKPANVLVDDLFRPFVTDFGVTLDATSTNGDQGTPGYLAPERLPEQKELEPSRRFLGDVYSLGVIAFELLAGRRPFEAPDSARVLVQQLYKEPPSLTTFRPDLPTVFDEIVRKAMARDPDLRTRSALAFAQDLGEARANLRRGAPRALLVVDDDPAFVSLVRAVVEEVMPAVRVDSAGTGEEALIAARATHYNAIAIDLQLPDVNGLELTALLSARGENTRLLVITGTGAARDWQVLSRMGATDFLLKPVDPENLGASLRRALYRDDS
ncbi:MAG: serine/threonine protein kinase [Polyangiales bacterium]